MSIQAGWNGRRCCFSAAVVTAAGRCEMATLPSELSEVPAFCSSAAAAAAGAAAGVAAAAAESASGRFAGSAREMGASSVTLQMEFRLHAHH